MNHLSKKIKTIESVLPELRKLLSPCQLCSRLCMSKRLKDEKGVCRAGLKPAVYSYSPHHGEEPPLSGRKGSGTIFFTHCNMKCVYCQNHSFSQAAKDLEEVTIEGLARLMLELQSIGCHNINLVSPTHYALQIVEALKIAIENGLNIPLVYNTGGYDSPGLIKLLGGIIDIYLVDMRYARNEMGEKYSSAPGYAKNNREIVKEMYRQAGKLVTRNVFRSKMESVPNGDTFSFGPKTFQIAKKGVIVRLLILPGNISGTVDTLKFLAKEVSKDIYLSVMSQYHPAYMAPNHPELARRINKEEYRRVVDEVEKLGFENGWIQGYLTDAEHFLGTRIQPGRFNWS